MQVKILATGIAPDYYEISGDTVTAHVGDHSDSYDLSSLEEGDVVTEATEVGGLQPFRHATREDGMLKVTLCQRVGAGHWVESEWMDASLYDSDGLNVIFDESKAFAGTPVFYTRQGPMTLGDSVEA